MKLRTYSSLAAFMAHYSALRAAHSDSAGGVRADASTPDDAATLIEMERLIGDLGAADRDALHDDNALTLHTLSWSSIELRHRARAEMHLRRLLAARGLLAG